MSPAGLGKCCICETEGSAVRNVLMLPFRSPKPGTGCWGCIQCGLPMAGAVAVLCDDCVGDNDPRFFCLGAPAENERAPYSSLTEPFDHDMSKHPGEENVSPADRGPLGYEQLPAMSETRSRRQIEHAAHLMGLSAGVAEQNNDEDGLQMASLAYAVLTWVLGEDDAAGFGETLARVQEMIARPRTWTQ